MNMNNHHAGTVNSGVRIWRNTINLQRSRQLTPYFYDTLVFKDEYIPVDWLIVSETMPVQNVSLFLTIVALHNQKRKHDRNVCGEAEYMQNVVQQQIIQHIVCDHLRT